MAFKLYSDSAVDRPLLVCGVCGKTTLDVWSDKVTGTPTKDGQTSDVVIHHASCVPSSGSVTMMLVDFLRLFVIQSRIGNLGSDGISDKVSVEYPMGKGFEE